MNGSLLKVRNRLICILLRVFTLSALIPAFSLAQESDNESIQDGNLRSYNPRQSIGYINLTGDNIETKDTTSQKKWKDVCNKVGHTSRYKKSQIGFLAKFKCVELDQKVPTKISPNLMAWNIHIDEGDQAITVSVSFLSDNRWHKVTEISFKNSAGVFKQFSGPETYFTLARILIDSLPVGWIYRPSDHKSGIRFIASHGLKSLPEKLYVYRVQFDEKNLKWFPKIAAVLKAKGGLLEAKGKWAQTYEYEKLYEPINTKGLYSVQNVGGLGKDKESLVKHLEKTNPLLSMLNLVDLLTFNALSSNYVGLKYAKSLNKKGSVLGEASQFSLLVEIRDGLLNGVRVYYEKIPNVTLSNEVGDQRLDMQRISGGWSFKLPLPEFMSTIANEVSIQPKVGITDFVGQFSIPINATDYASINYQLNGVLDLAAELGVEKETNWFRARLWGSINTSAASKIASSAGSVTSIRAGVDTYWDVASFSDTVTLNLLAFANYERLQLSKPVTTEDPADLVGTNIGFNLALVGGGITLEW